MNTKSLNYLGAAIILLAAVACSRPEPDVDMAAYEREILDWRADRLDKLVAPIGYLTQIGLHWLEAGEKIEPELHYGP